MEQRIDEIAMEYALRCHRETNHKYNDQDYSYHLSMVFGYGYRYSHLLPKHKLYIILASCWTHDVIEDCRQTYNDVKKVCGEEVANITYALTNEKGRNRAERANEKYYQGITTTPYAIYVKLCDRLANVKYSVDNGHSMIEAYRKEQKEFKEKLYFGSYVDMWDELDNLLDTSPFSK